MGDGTKKQVRRPVSSIVVICCCCCYFFVYNDDCYLIVMFVHFIYCCNYLFYLQFVVAKPLCSHHD